MRPLAHLLAEWLGYGKLCISIDTGSGEYCIGLFGGHCHVRYVN